MQNFKTSAQHLHLTRGCNANAAQMSKPIYLHRIWILYWFFYHNQWNTPLSQMKNILVTSLLSFPHTAGALQSFASETYSEENRIKSTGKTAICFHGLNGILQLIHA